MLNRLVYLVFFGCALILFVPAILQGVPNILSWESFGYYLYLPSNFIYDDIIYASLASMLTSKPQDDSLKFEALNNRLNSIQELGLNQQAKKIFHFRVLVDYLVNLNNSAIELEKTYNYKFLASPVFYKKLNEIQSIISSQIEKNLVIEADSTAFDSLAPIQ